jgi:hypothetical protein
LVPQLKTGKISRVRHPLLWPVNVRAAVAGSLLAGLRPAGAGLDPAYDLPKGIRPECNSPHRISGEGLDLRFGLALVFRQSHPLTDDLPALIVFRLHVRSLSTVYVTNFAAAPAVGDVKAAAA